MGTLKTKYLIVHTIGGIAVTAAVAVCFIVDVKLGYRVLSYCALAILVFGAGWMFSLIMNKVRSREKGERLFSDISAFMLGGYIECFLDSDLTIKYCSEKLISYLGYEYDEFIAVTQNKLVNIIAPEDNERTVNEYREPQYGQNAQILFNMLAKGGRKVSVIAIVSPPAKTFKRGKENIVAQSLIIDTMPFARLNEEKDIDAERYRVVAEQSESIIFDYHIATDSIYINSNFEKKFGYVIENGNFKSRVKSEELLKCDDRRKLNNIDIKNIPYTETEVQVKKADGEYIWCKIRLSTIYDKEKNPVRLLGKIIDVDASRKEKQLLIERTKRDVLTGLYNRLATETLVSEAQANSAADAISAFILFDVDDFKKINDEYGHLKGDEVLSQMTESIKTIFRSTDIIGRIGGDEFVIFIKDIPNQKHALKKARSVLALVSREFRAVGAGVSVSIGISMFRKDGDTYHELFRKADLALYASKAMGKNTFTLYTSELERNDN
ncbi:MAG: sensor domain-containing diguanylate cyclase [Clostridia bacterium]